jgi:hypothetical protein
VLDGGAVPEAVPELVLALEDAALGALADAVHVVLVQVTELRLARAHPGDEGAQFLGLRVVRDRVPPHLSPFHCYVPERKRRKRKI